MRRIRLRSWAILTVMAIVLAACGGDDGADTTTSEPVDTTAPPATEAPADDTTTTAGPTTTTEPVIEYSIQMPGVISYELNLPTLVADAAGLLAAEGVEISDYVIASGGDLRQAVIAGEFDHGLFATVHPVLATSAGDPWKIIFGAHEKEIFSLVVRSELQDEVQSVEDLAGHTVGFTSPGAGAWFMGLVYLGSAGLDPDTDIEYLALGGDPGVIYTSLQNGNVDAFVTWEPTTSRVIADGVAYPVVNIAEDHTEYVGEKALSMVLIATEEAVAENPDLYERLVNAHLAAMEYIADASSEEIVDLVVENESTAQFFEGLDRDLLIQIIDNIRGGFGTGCIDRAGYETELDILLEFEVIEEGVPFDDVVDTSFAGEC